MGSVSTTNVTIGAWKKKMQNMAVALMEIATATTIVENNNQNI
ncbi:hypothetical protein MTR67_030278 [Solanum verrucosum]|uniref:Uncharacterized protein n=1 Tax=Solanum verrucosum TaxID=315347 RepID=A0AAF0U112_SOLVR|nr:hypothetical protein MTR67_030278 [Solanum verrucosum]